MIDWCAEKFWPRHRKLLRLIGKSPSFNLMSSYRYGGKCSCYNRSELLSRVRIQVVIDTFTYAQILQVELWNHLIPQIWIKLSDMHLKKIILIIQIFINNFREPFSDHLYSSMQMISDIIKIPPKIKIFRVFKLISPLI